MANIKIRLVVNTKKLEKQTKEQIETYCSIVDNTTDNLKKSKKPEDHLTAVDQAQTIEWSGFAKNPNIFDQVSIDSITYENKKPKNSKTEKDLFGVRFLTGVNGVIYGSVIAKKLKPTDEETYRINFTVIKADGTSKSYFVDPKLRVKT